MTQTEFKRWYRAHVAAFPSIHAWFQRFPDEETESMPTRSEVMFEWYSALQTCEFDDCLVATRRFSAGDLDPPKFPEEHARAVRRISAELGAKRRAETFKALPQVREESFKCLLCRDRGIVTCWHPVSMAAMRKGVFGAARTIYTTAVRCSCAAGLRRTFPPCVFEERLWVKAEPMSCAESVEKLREWSENFNPNAGTEWQY